MVVTFIDRDILVLFPDKERFQAIGAKILDGIAKTPMKLKDITANFAFKLRTFFAIIVIDIDVGCLTMRTSGMLGHAVVSRPDLNGFQWFAVFGFIFRNQFIEN